MITIVNLNNVVEKELELERQGFRRTRRWIGDASQVTDAKWYQAKVSKVSGTTHNLDEVSQVAEIKPNWKVNSSFLARISNLFSTRQPISSKG